MIEEKMPSEPLKDAQYVVKPYYGFVVDKLNVILYQWYYGNYMSALQMAYALASSLPKEIREHLKEDMKKIRNEQAKCMRLKGIGWFGTSRMVNRCLRKVAQEYFEKFYNKLFAEIENRDYFEKPFFMGVKKDSKHISEDIFK